MDNVVVQKIIAGKIPCYFVSPHLDDAALSAGGLIAHLSRHTRVIVITVFTHASPRPYTLSAKAFMKQCGYADADALFGDRRNEDAGACALVGAVPHHLGRVDALWRKIPSPRFLRRILSRLVPELLHVYPTYRLHIIRGKVSQNDAPLSEALGKDLKKIIGGRTESVVFCPLALRSHVDHALVRDACLANFDRVILWRDFPYHIRHAANAREIGVLGSEAFQWDAESEMKEKMAASYASQMQAMFPDGHIPLAPEVYYFPRGKKRV